MMKKKNIFKCGIVSIMTLVFALGVSVLPVSASESNNNISSKAFYIETETVPDEAIDYAVNNVFDYLVARSCEESFELYDVTMGSPFSMGKETDNDIDVYYFPILSGEQFIYTFRVFEEDGQYTGILSPYMVEQLNKYTDDTSQSEPLYIYMQAGNVIAEKDGEIDIWEEQHAGYEVNENQLIALADNSVLESTDICTPIEYKKEAIPRAVSSKTLSLDMAETQGDQQWCAAFAMSSILRYKGAGSSVTAEAIVKYFYPNSTNLKNESVSRTQLVNYAKNKGYSKTTNSSSTLSNSTVVSEIGNDTPIYAGCAGSGSYEKARHALVICGYNNTKSTYTVWNPWYSYTETMSQSTKKYVVNSSSSFTWDCTIYKVRK